MNAITKTRIKKELEIFGSSPPPGISCASLDDKLNRFTAQIMGASGTPYEGGVFSLDIQIPDRYPFEPPSIRFVSPIYHPNVDTLGRICLDTLKPPPQGSWKPHLNIAAVLMMIRVLMAEPGEEDPLMTEIWQEYKYDYVTYVRKAREWTKKHASDQNTSSNKPTTKKGLPLAPDENRDPNPTTTTSTPGGGSGKLTIARKMGGTEVSKRTSKPDPDTMESSSAGFHGGGPVNKRTCLSLSETRQ